MIKFEIPVGWKSYLVSSDELLNIVGMGICDDCNEFSKNGFLVPVLNHYMCPQCFLDWISVCKFYPSDVEFEKHYCSVFETLIPDFYEVDYNSIYRLLLSMYE